jgi:CBS domain-containing protein
MPPERSVRYKAVGISLLLMSKEYHYPIELMEIRDLAKEAVIVSEDSTFRDVVSLMVSKQTNNILVVDEDGKLSGEISVSDLMNGIVPDYLEPNLVLDELSTEAGFRKAVRAAGDKIVSDFMSVDFEPVHAEDNLLTIAGTALAHSTESIPIVDADNHPIGVISRMGLKHILAEYLEIKS